MRHPVLLPGLDESRSRIFGELQSSKVLCFVGFLELQASFLAYIKTTFIGKQMDSIGEHIDNDDWGLTWCGYN